MEMNKRPLYTLIESAGNGYTQALEELLENILPLINVNSKVNGEIDNDLRSEIIFTLYTRLPKYKI